MRRYKRTHLVSIESEQRFVLQQLREQVGKPAVFEPSSELRNICRRLEIAIRACFKCMEPLELTALNRGDKLVYPCLYVSVSHV
jgi:hypothetical protein